MSTLGFRSGTRQDFVDLVMEAVKVGKKIELPDGGSYRVWSPGEGIELWGQISQQGEIFGMDPHFSGNARMQAGLIERINRPQDNTMDGAFYAWADALEDDPEGGDYPFVFDAPDYRTYDTLQLPKTVNVQLAAFAHDLKAFENEEALRASGSKMAAESCIPSGTFTPGPEGGAITPPKSEVIAYGRVLETASLVNPISHLSFYWAKVRTLGGEFDVVADPEIVKGTIVKNGIVGGVFWLSGRLK